MSFLRWLKALLFSRRSSIRDASEDESTTHSGGEPMISLVLLLRGPRYLDAAILCHAVNQAWGIDLGSAGADDTEFVVGEGNPLIIQCRRGTFLVNNFPVPYIDDREQAASDAKELRIRKALLEHEAWMSVDLITTGEPSIGSEAAYRAIGALASVLIDDDCLAAYCPETGRAASCNDDLRQRLETEGAKAALDEPSVAPVVGISAEDPRMVAAVAIARQQWPEFVAAFENRQPGDAHLVKAPFGEGVDIEHMWISVDALEQGRIYGHLENEPINVPRLHAGDQVRIDAAELSDWLIATQAGPKGGFTIAAMKRAAEES